MEEPVYLEFHWEDVSSNHGSGEILYRVFVGTVNWTKRAGGEKVAFVILMKYDGRLAYHIPAHILEEDAGAVFDALERMRVWRASNS
jgi:hypothetical protein